MDSTQFHRVITAFADHSGDLRFDRDRLRVQVLDELIEASFRERDGEVFVKENGVEIRALSWIRDRVARLSQLADCIRANIPREESFVPPPGTFLERPDDPSASPEVLPDARRGIQEILARPASDRSTVLYLTSDYGEGKTTLINHLAHEQARRFQARESSFLLVPIRLAGRSFLTFDEMVVVELVNRLRVPFFYYGAFIELVRLKILVPAFDGFEELFVESSTGEAAFSLGYLLDRMESSGSLVLAARRAFFEYRNLETQAQLFDTIGDRNVGFAQVRLEPWNRTHFVEYARKRSVADPERVYDRLRRHFDEDHPSLTRALLVGRLLDVSESGDLEDLLRRLGNASSDYFHEFVNALVSREAQDWTDPESDGARRPLLSVAEHHSLLAEIAMEMWRTKNDTLSLEYLDSVTEEFAEANGKPRRVLGQIKELLRHHALLAPVLGRVRSLHFEHEDFRHFYLGEALGDLLRSSEHPAEIARILGPRPLARVASDGAGNALVRRDTDVRAALDRLREVARHSPLTYAQENLGAIASRLLEWSDEAVTVRVFGLWFPSDALKGREFGTVVFEKCRFQGTSLAGTVVANCTFVECRFERLEMTPGFDARGALLKDCRVACLVSAGDSEDGVFDPEEIAGDLEDAGFRIERMEAAETHGLASVDPDARLAERALRCFVRGTRISEEVLRRWLGSDAPAFFERVLPKLVEGGVLRSIEHDGSGPRRRFGLAVRMSGLVPAVPTMAGSIDEFLATVRRDRRMARG